MHSILFLLMAAPQDASGGMAVLLFQVALIGIVFWFLIIRPQGQARKKHAEMLAALKKGDEITTAGGVIGKVKDVKDDRVTIESGTSVLLIDRARIIRVGDTAASPGLQ